MRCRQCGKDCLLTKAQSVFISEDTYQTTRFYKCPKCGKVYEVVDDPVKKGA